MFGVEQTQVYDFSNKFIFDLDTKTVAFNISPSTSISSELIDKEGIENFNEYITDNHDLAYNMPKNRIRMDSGLDNVYAIDNSYLMFVTYKTTNNTRIYINENIFYNFKKNDTQKLKRLLKIKELNG